MKEQKAFQDYYSDEVSQCYGCGRLNPHGYQFKSYWDGEVAVCTYRPLPRHTAIPGFVYGGLIASIIDCHSTGTAAAAVYRAQGREMDSLPEMRYVTASLKVDYIRPTPIDEAMEVRATVEDIKGRKVVVASSLFSGGEECVKGLVIVVQIPDGWLDNLV